MSIQTRDSASGCRALEPISTVLIGTALDEHSDQVVRAGRAVARATGARLHLVHAAEMQPITAELQGDWLTPTLRESIAAEREKELHGQVRRCGLDATEVASARAVIDAPHRALLRAARETRAQLIVIGPTTHTGRLGRLFGSTADRVTRQATCPVLVVRGDLPIPPRNVVAPVDLSSLSADALRCGLDLLGQLGGREVSTLEVVFALELDPRHVPAPFTPAQMERFAGEELARFVAEHGGSRGGAPLAAHRRVLRGEARREILGHLEEVEADLVMLGTHGHGGAERLLLGSVASEVAREARVSVLLIPPATLLGAALSDAVASQTAPVFHRETPVPAGTGRR